MFAKMRLLKIQYVDQSRLGLNIRGFSWLYRWNLLGWSNWTPMSTTCHSSVCLFDIRTRILVERIKSNTAQASSVFIDIVSSIPESRILLATIPLVASLNIDDTTWGMAWEGGAATPHYTLRDITAQVVVNVSVKSDPWIERSYSRGSRLFSAQWRNLRLLSLLLFYMN